MSRIFPPSAFHDWETQRCVTVPVTGVPVTGRPATACGPVRRGFLGPYGSTMVTPMVHEVAAGLDSTPRLAAAAVTAYMLPFAALMLISGTLAERWGRRRVLRVALAAFVVATALCAVAPTMEFFLTARAFQGATNAFTTPARGGHLRPGGRARLAKALSWFAAAQATGQGMSPLFSGVSAAVDWRLAFLLPGLCGLLLVCFPPSRSATRRVATAPPPGAPWPTGGSRWPARSPSSPTSPRSASPCWPCCA
ncbi:MFS transporter [Streptomyces sp. M19]